MPIAILDIIVIVVMLISAVLAMVRGFTREVLAIASWIAAAVATILLFPQAQALARQYIPIEPKIIADVAGAGTVFLVTLIIVSFITMKISDLILDSRVGPLDRTLGFVFGAARGLLLAVIAFLFFNWLVPPSNQPPWVREAKSRAILEDAGNQLLAMLPDDPESTILQRFKRGPAGDTEPADTPDADAPASPTTPPAAVPGTPAPAEGQRSDAGYPRSQTQTMRRLLESTTAAR
jgi:membrane protein required for colicin V production